MQAYYKNLQKSPESPEIFDFAATLQVDRAILLRVECFFCKKYGCAGSQRYFFGIYRIAANSRQPHKNREANQYWLQIIGDDTRINKP